jgi:hypothetical protein
MAAFFKKVKVEHEDDVQPSSVWTPPTSKAAGASQSAPDAMGLGDMLVAQSALTQAEADMLVVPEGGVSELFCDALVAYIDNDFDKAESAIQAAALGLIQGVYWKVGEHNGRPFFKHAEEPVSLWFFEAPAEQGWYFSNHIWPSVADKNKDEELEIFGWAEGDGLPMKVHCPFWAKKAVKNVHMTSLHQFNVMQINNLQNSLGQAPEHANHHLDQDQITQTDFEDGDDKGDGKGDDNHANRNSDGEVVRGGWLPRVSNLVAAVWSKDWDAVEKYCLECYNNGTCRWMVNKYLAKLKKGKSKSSKGGGKGSKGGGQGSKSSKPVGDVWKGGNHKYGNRSW